jgi:hypothetical protein
MNYKYLEETHSGETLAERQIFGDHKIFLIKEDKKFYLVARVIIDANHPYRPTQELFYRAPAPAMSKLGPLSDHQGQSFIPDDNGSDGGALRSLEWTSCQTGKKLSRNDFPRANGIYDELELTVLQAPTKFHGATFLEKLEGAKAIREKLRHVDGRGNIRDAKGRIIDWKTGKPKSRRQHLAERSAALEKAPVEE